MSDQLADRVSMLEAVISRMVAPRALEPAPAAAPPIVIGPFDNVPAPGSPIRSDWPQEISQYVVDNESKQTVAMNLSGQVRYNHLQIIAVAAVNVSTDATGLFSLAFPSPFVGLAPVVSAWLASATSPWRAAAVSANVTGFTGRGLNEVGGALASQTFTIGYQAIGRWAT
jgi:hypothetical protein